MTSSQRIIKQTIIASVYILITATIVFLIVINLFPPNLEIVEDQGLIQQPIQIVKSGKIDLGNNKSDFWAEIKNPNDEYGVSKLEYSFILKKSNGEEFRENGETFILPGDEKRYVLLFEMSSDYELQGFEINQDLEWTSLSKFVLPELVTRNTEIGYSSKAGNAFTVFSTLTNASTVNLKNIEVIAILKDDKDEIIGVNQTLIRDVLTSESRDFEMTWDNEVSGSSKFNTQIYVQSNVLSNNSLLIELQQTPVFDR